ncbi:MAG: hypothetical protein IPL14_12600 [Nitrospira sp.]|nr:hypothetical protein [Nitrospira sp.]
MQTQSRVQPQQWVVKTRRGSVVGHVKSLTICHCSKQIVSALLVLRNSGQQVQIPWNRVDMVEEQLVLRVPVGRLTRELQSRRKPMARQISDMESREAINRKSGATRSGRRISRRALSSDFC